MASSFTWKGVALMMMMMTMMSCHAFVRPSLSGKSRGTARNMAVQTEESSRVFLLGVGFTQFLMAQQLSRCGLKSVAMTDVAKIDNMRQNWITSNLCTLVTNGENEWEAEAATCTSMVICPEVANIPGRTIEVLLSKMPNVNRIVILNPAGTTRPEEKKQDNNWLSSIFKKEGPSATDDFMDYARSVEDVVLEKVKSGLVEEAIVVHRGKLNGGGGEFGLGDIYYKVCGSEPEEVLQRCYDNGRVGTNILPGDTMDISPKIKYPKTANDNEDDIMLKNLMEELKDKSHRLVVVNAIVATLLMENPPNRFSVPCSLSEIPLLRDDVQKAILEANNAMTV